MASAYLNDLRTALLGECHSGGIVKIRQTVKKLDATPFALELNDCLLQSLRDDAVGIDGNLLYIGLVGRED